MMRPSTISRREFALGSAAAAAVLSGCAGSTATPPTPSAQIFDAIVVGAGAAGIAAARAVQSTNRSVLILEAQPLIGGRCRTDSTTYPVPFDFGGQFMTQVGSLNNVLYPLAQQLGIPLIQSAQVPALFYDATGNPADLTSFALTFAAANTAIQNYGPLIDLGSPDVSVAQLMQSAGLTNAPYINLALQFLMEVIDGGDAATQSVQDLFAVTQFLPIPFIYPPSDTNYMPTGYGAFIARLAKGLPITTSSPVKTIDTSGSNVVVTTVSGQQYTAKTVIVTASIGVLQSGSITFNPPLPATHRTAISNIKMGNAYKTMLEFSKPFTSASLGIQAGKMSQALQLVNSESTAFIVNYFAQQFPGPKTYMMVIADGPPADALEAMGPVKAGQALCAQLETPFPGTTAAWTGGVVASNWRSNAYTLGGLSFCTTGNASARATLAQAVASKLWLAGEAITNHAHGLVHGAWASGTQAGLAAMGSIGALIRAPQSQS